MKVDIRANGDPETSHVIEDWPHEWRLPVVGERIDIKEISDTTLEVSHVFWVKETRDGGTYWGVQLWVWGPALRPALRVANVKVEGSSVTYDEV